MIVGVIELINRENILHVEELPQNYGEIEAKKAINELFDNLKNDTNYNSEFVWEMNETEKQESIPIFKYEDLFDDD